MKDLVKDAVPATAVEIDTYMSAIGFTKMAVDGRYIHGRLAHYICPQHAYVLRAGWGALRDFPVSVVIPLFTNVTCDM